MPAFRHAHAAADHWSLIADACAAQLGEIPPTANLGFVYVTDALADTLGEFLIRLRNLTNVTHWVGSVGMGICATGIEYYDQPAAAVMLGEFPPDSFRVFAGIDADLTDFDARHGDWIREHQPYLGLVHGDPANPHIEALIEQLAQRTSAGFLVGGLASSRDAALCIAETPTAGGLSGVLFAAQVGLLTRLTQGCSPIGPHHRITEAQRNIIVTLDGQPALDILRQDIGETLGSDLFQLGGVLFAGLPIPSSDTGDYLVRNLIGIDPQHRVIAIGDLVESGRELMFCKRDAESAREDLDRMLGALRARLNQPPRGGVYVSCLGRGINMFGPDAAELRQIGAALGDIPLVGFYANGEISRDRLYGYTGVLTLFA